MKLDYYTLEQAARFIGCYVDEILFYIGAEKANIHYFSDDKNFVVVQSQQGIGIANYRGIFKLPNSGLIEYTPEDEGFFFGKVELIDRQGVRAWNNLLPIDPEIYIRETELKISGWNPMPLKSLDTIDQILAIPFPEFGTPYMQKEHRKECEAHLQKYPNAIRHQYDYCWGTNSSFSEADIRITHGDLLAFQEFTRCLLNQTQENKNLPAEVKQNKIRASELHELLLRILAENPEMKALEVWLLLKADIERERRIYDTDEIILAISPEELIWESSYQVKQFQKKTSFPVTISRLKKALKGTVSK